LLDVKCFTCVNFWYIFVLQIWHLQPSRWERSHRARLVITIVMDFALSLEVIWVLALALRSPSWPCVVLGLEVAGLDLGS